MQATQSTEGYDASKDEKVGLIPVTNTNIVLQICRYNGGQIKVQLNRLSYNGMPAQKLGRVKVSEARALRQALDQVLEQYG